MDKHTKELFVEGMNSRLKKAKATFIVDYQGLDVQEMNRIRSELRNINSEIQVVKNRLLKLACKDTDTEAIKDQFSGPCALAITYDDIVAPAKVLINLNKELKNLEVKVGQISGKLIDADAIKRLSELPGRDQLLSQVLSAMQAVPTSLVRALNGVILNLIYALKAVEAQKGE